MKVFYTLWVRSKDGNAFNNGKWYLYTPNGTTTWTVDSISEAFNAVASMEDIYAHLSEVHVHQTIVEWVE